MTSSEFSVEGTASVKDEMGGQCSVLSEELVEQAWRSLIEMDDRTSPEEYPDMALIKFDELREIIAGFVTVARRAAAPSRDQVTMGALREAIKPFIAEAMRLGISGTRRDSERMPVLVDVGDIRLAVSAFRSSERLVPTAEQGVDCDEQFALATRLAGELGYDLVPEPPHPDTPRDNFGGPPLTPPIAGAGEELVERLEEASITLRTLHWPGLADAVDEAVASLSQLYSRIGEIQRERDEWQERALTCENSISKHEADEARWSREAVEARLAEAREALVACDRQLVNMFRAACPHGNYGDGQTGGNRFADNDEAVIRARSFHSPKEPGPAGGGE